MIDFRIKSKYVFITYVALSLLKWPVLADENNMAAFMLFTLSRLEPFFILI